MMIFMGLLFYKVPSGLCVYFVASSLWGLAERKFLPKPRAGGTTPSAGSEKRILRWPGSSNRDGNGQQRKKKNRGKR
jgi:YidC/Oxa1 family membrane protein insertase